MTFFKYDDVIKKSCDLNYYVDVFWKILCSTTHVQSSTPDYLMSKSPGRLGLK